MVFDCNDSFYLFDVSLELFCTLRIGAYGTHMKRPTHEILRKTMLTFILEL